MTNNLFTNTKKRKKKQPKDVFWWTRTAGLIALGVCFAYWGFLRSDDHAWLSRVFLASAIAFNLFYTYLVYNREMKRRESERE